MAPGNGAGARSIEWALNIVGQREVAMTRSEIDAMLEKVRSWPVERQARLAQIVAHMDVVDEIDLDDEDDETRAAIAEGLAQIERGEFATEEEVEAAFARFRK
jgi:predicted transcriptional regulator